MFALLNQTYGDPATATCIIVNKLQNLTLSDRSEYENILELTMIINRNALLLGRLGEEAMNHVRFNKNILAHLINLLPANYKDKWFDHKIEQPTTLNHWNMFTDWLKTMERRANAEKLTEMSRPVEEDSGRPPPVGEGHEDPEGFYADGYDVI